ncbi:hypothetical protein K402DRAFT_416496 [Aulographum hederae CBS 113979]|uniref:C2H2-type domain-containing protein n=1 Tax=Aulographum hederae CBS 113979 TaxID=1176131 RepID=A0A6G1HFZ1_9PEZI|nr:hypothetical protein K402DRAFT_416496 [Aulographum hederae CBS 113979]
MPNHDFDLFNSSQDSYPDLLAPSTGQSYLPTGAYFESPFGAAMSTLDAYPPVHAFSQTPRSHEFLGTAQHVKGHLNQYSPAASPASQSFETAPPQLTSSESSASIHSTSSSAIGSPSLNPQPQYQESWGLQGSQGDFHPQSFTTAGFDLKLSGFVDPTLINPFTSPIQYTTASFPPNPAIQSPRIPFFEHPPSPAPSNTSAHSQLHMDSRRFKQSASQSPYLRTNSFQPYPQYPGARRPSASSIHSGNSHNSRRSGSYEIDGELQEKGLCPIPECGRVFKDLKAHMLTHQNERPEKCPILTCEYHVKGFARKYDKNRHTLTHYKGTMVCGFCPGSGSAAEKSFNRADVFKRHLTSVHGVEQTPPNSRKKSPQQGKKGNLAMQSTAAGTCSTCDVTFANAQEFYEHLDDCVLRVVQQADPCEAINQKNLTSIADDDGVKKTLERHHLPSTVDFAATSFSGEDDEEEEEDGDEDDHADETYGSRTRKARMGRRNPLKPSGGSGGSASISKASRFTQPSTSTTSSARRGMTFSSGGIPLIGASASGRKKRKHYPASWGCATDKMRMKKRVLCVYDGQRRLWKDDMMLDQEFEVRLKLPGGEGKSWVTDLDVQTLRRAEALHGATEEERGPWVADNVVDGGEGGEDAALVGLVIFPTPFGGLAGALAGNVGGLVYITSIAPEIGPDGTPSCLVTSGTYLGNTNAPRLNAPMWWDGRL